MLVVATKSFNKDILRIKYKKLLKKIDDTIQLTVFASRKEIYKYFP